jgi:hypothetical protein
VEEIPTIVAIAFLPAVLLKELLFVIVVLD